MTTAVSPAQNLHPAAQARPGGPTRDRFYDDVSVSPVIRMSPGFSALSVSGKPTSRGCGLAAVPVLRCAPGRQRSRASPACREV